MASQKPHIFNRFPTKTQLISYCMAIDSDFYDLCQDYEACFSALLYWLTVNDPDARDRLDEYRTIMTELEQDIVDELETFSRKH